MSKRATVYKRQSQPNQSSTAKVQERSKGQATEMARKQYNQYTFLPCRTMDFLIHRTSSEREGDVSEKDHRRQTRHRRHYDASEVEEVAL